MFDYFYGQSGEMFSYFRVPKILFRDIKFKDLSTDAKTLYRILLDRMGLSVKNGWLDEQGRVYIIFPVQEVMDALGCADNKATKLFRELEKFGLIERKRRGLGKPNLIYVKNFADPRCRNCGKNGSGAADSAQPETAKSRGNKTEWNKTEGSEPDPFSSDAEDEPDERTRLEAYFMQSLEVDLLLRVCPDEEDTIHQIVNLLVDTCFTKRKLLLLKQVLDSTRREYDYILLDCTPSLGMLTVVAPLLWLAVRTMCEFIIISCGDTAINALAAADTTLIPVQAQYLSAKGLEQLMQTIQKVRRQINPKLKIEGILMTMTDSRTNYGREIDALIRQVYGSKIRVFEQPVPHSVRAAEISAEGRSIFAHDPKGKVAAAYQSLTREVLADAEKQRKLGAERSR